CDVAADLALLAACEPSRNTICTADATTPLDGEPLHSPSIAFVSGSLPIAGGQHTVWALLGEATLTPASDPFVPPDPVSVTPSGTLNLRAAPSTDAEVIAGLQGGTSYLADALDPSGEWARVAWANSSGWAAADFLTGNLSTLPSVEPDAFGPYEASALDLGACGAVVVQPPRVTSLPVELDGERLTLNGTVVIEEDSNGARVVVAVDGGVRLPDGVRVPRGFMARWSDAGWSSPRPMTAEQVARYTAFAELPLNELMVVPDGAYIWHDVSVGNQ
ncbi:MAG: SH3 domain-containing protein, partial [Chloroflexota bacterium]